MIGIYKIENKITNEIYVGSSKNIERRWASHRNKAHWKQCPNSKLYKDFQKFGLENFQFSVIENCEISDLRKREDFYIQSLQPQYNTIRAYNPDYQKNYHKTEEYKNYQKKYLKKYSKNYNRNYKSRLCNYKGETLTLNALLQRLSKLGIHHPTQEAKKYLAS